MPSSFRAFSVGNSQYTVQLMSPMEAMDFGFRVAKIVAPIILVGASGEEGGDNMLSGIDPQKLVAALKEVSAEELTSLTRTALQHCLNSKQEPLSNEANFNAWFREHPEEMFQAGILAIKELVKDFFPVAQFMPKN